MHPPADSTLHRTAAQRQAAPPKTGVVQVALFAMPLQITDRCPHGMLVGQLPSEMTQLQDHVEPFSLTQPFPQLLEDPATLCCIWEQLLQRQTNMMHRVTPVQGPVHTPDVQADTPDHPVPAFPHPRRPISPLPTLPRPAPRPSSASAWPAV